MLDPKNALPDLAQHLDWVQAQLGQRLIGYQRLQGGISSTVVRCWLTESQSVVLRVIDDAEWLAREPELINQEARALQILANGPLSAPRFLAAESTTTVGRLLMSWLPGRMAVSAQELVTRLTDLADVAVAIASTPLPDDHGLLPWRTWAAAEPEPPPWGDHGLWAEAIGRHAEQRPPEPLSPVLLHRDLHPLNLLFRSPTANKEPTPPAVVDWVNACVGHPHAELAHCRWNLTVLVDGKAADRFLQHYVGRTIDRFGPYSPWWDIESVLDKIPGPPTVQGWHAVGRTDLTAGKVGAATEAFLRSVLA